MPTATLDKDYDYYGGSRPNNSGRPDSQPRVKKGLGAMPMQAVEDRNPTTPPPPTSHHGVDPPETAADYQQSPPSQEDPPQPETDQGQTVEGDEALLDLEQLEELHHEAERMKALGNKHMAAQVRIRT